MQSLAIGDIGGAEEMKEVYYRILSTNLGIARSTIHRVNDIINSIHIRVCLPKVGISILINISRNSKLHQANTATFY